MGAVRAERRADAEPPAIAAGPSNFTPRAGAVGRRPGRRLGLAASWSSPRPATLILLAARLLRGRSCCRSSIALLIAALVAPVVRWLQPRSACPAGWPRPLVVVGGLAVGRRAAHLRRPAGRQRRHRPRRPGRRRASSEIRDWLQDGPLNASDSQINDYIDQAQEAITEQHRGRRGRSPRSPRSAPRSATSSPASSSCCSRPTSSSPTATGSGPGWSGSSPRAARERGRQLGPGRLDLADPVRPGHRDRRGRRRDRHHDRGRDPRRAVRAARSACWSSSAPSSR